MQLRVARVLERPQVVAVERRARLFADQSAAEVYECGEAARRVELLLMLVVLMRMVGVVAVRVESDLGDESSEQVVDVVVERRRDRHVLAAERATHPPCFCIHTAPHGVQQQ